MQKKFRLVALLFGLLGSFTSMAQYSMSSPYSRYGIGGTDMIGNQTIASMGGVGQALHRNTLVNTLNPASYSAIDTQSFVFDIGFSMGWRTISTNEHSSNSFLAELTNISFGFPITKYLKAGINLSPLSDVSYKSAETVPASALVPGYTKSFEGTGELDKITLGLAYQPLFNDFWKRFSIGVNASYIFGNIARNATVAFIDTTGYLNDRREVNYNVSAFSFDFGLQYFQPLTNGDRLGIGLTYSLPMQYNTNNVAFYYTYYQYAGAEYVQDTIEFSKNKGNINMPQRISGGISYEKPNKLFVGADATYTAWSDYSFQGESTADIMKDNLKLNFGAEFVPNIYGGYLQRFAYRAGVNFDNGYIYLKDHRISKLGISFGFAMPVKKLGTNINFNFEYGKMGTHEDGLIKEDYFRIGLSITAKDRWFVQRKYK